MFHGLLSLLLCVACIAPSAVGAPQADAITIALKPDAVVQSDVILLKDVADLTGKDAARIQKLNQIILGEAPPFGGARALSRSQIAEAMHNAGGSIPAGGITGAQAVQIKFEGRTADPQEIMALIQSYLEKTGHWQADEIHVDSIGNMRGIELPSGQCTLQLSSNGLTLGHKNVLAAVEVLQNGRIVRSFWITAGVRITAEVVTAARKISSGEPVTEDSLVTKNVDITDLRAAYARNPDDLIGKIASKTILPGEPLALNAVKEPLLIKHGETVSLRLERNGIILNSKGRAEQDGRLGQIIRVRNIGFSTVLKAQVTGRAQVTLQ